MSVLKQRLDRLLPRLDDLNEASEDGLFLDELRLMFAPHVRDLDAFEALLTFAHDERMADARARLAVPEALSMILVEALEHWMPLLGDQAVGSLENLLVHAQGLYDRERKKLSLVEEYLPKVSAERAQEILLGYLSTRPARLFLATLEHGDFATALELARCEFAHRTDVGVLTQDAVLLQLLRDPPPMPQLLARHMNATLSVLPDAQTLLHVALHHEDEDVVLVAAGLTAYLGQKDDASQILQRLTRMDKDAPILATLATKLAPTMSKHTMALLLADASWGNPEEPERAMTPERARALTAMYCLLPKLGGPITGTEEVSFGNATRAFGVDDVPVLVDRLWGCWMALRLN